MTEQDATSDTANLERGERIGITASFENVSEKNNTSRVLNSNDETRGNFPDELSELLVSGTHFDRQLHTHHRQHHFSCPNAGNEKLKSNNETGTRLIFRPKLKMRTLL